MKKDTFTFIDPENYEIFVYRWSPDNKKNPKGVVQISHGMAEHALRYERFAEQLTAQGYLVYANDHRGHGKTAKSLENVGFIGEKNGFQWLVNDMHQLTGMIKKENPGLPVFLFAHSMGSFLGQYYISQFGDELKGVVLSGSAGPYGPELSVGILLAKLQMLLFGKKHRSMLLNVLSFGAYNNQFKPNRTLFDWISSDPAEVDKYVGDPFCGGVFTASFFETFLTGLSRMHRDVLLANVPKGLPVFIISGANDPVGGKTKSVKKLADLYRSYGLKDVNSRFYAGGRHELLNETFRDIVMKDVIDWLNSRLLALPSD